MGGGNDIYLGIFNERFFKKEEENSLLVKK